MVRRPLHEAKVVLWCKLTGNFNLGTFGTDLSPAISQSHVNQDHPISLQWISGFGDNSNTEFTHQIRKLCRICNIPSNVRFNRFLFTWYVHHLRHAKCHLVLGSALSREEFANNKIFALLLHSVVFIGSFPFSLFLPIGAIFPAKNSAQF